MAGYTSFATLLTRFPELTMIRKFDKLSIRLLLYQQAELLYLEKDLDLFIDMDIEKESLADMDKCWMILNQTFLRGDCSLQKQKLDDIKIKLKDYHETLLRMHRIQSLKSPTASTRRSVKDWLSRKEGGDGFLNHVEVDPWLEPQKLDLVSLREAKDDGFDGWLADKLTPVYHRLWGHRKKPDVEAASRTGPVWEYNMATYSMLGSFICVLSSCAVPLVSILGLYYAHESWLRLTLISVFTVLFAVLMSTVAGSKRSDIFAATVAFAAVQVVFLQGINGIYS